MLFALQTWLLALAVAPNISWRMRECGVRRITPTWAVAQYVLQLALRKLCDVGRQAV